MKPRTLLFISVFVSLFSCKEKTARDISSSIIEIVPERITDTLAYSSIMELTAFIPFESTKESIIGEASKIILHNDIFYVADRVTHKVLMFDGEGKYIGQIGNVGRGPDEYVRLGNIALDKAAENIIISSVMPRKIMIFDLEGNFLRGLATDIAAYDIAVSGGKFLLYANSATRDAADRSQVYVMDSDGKIISEQFGYEDVRCYPYPIMLFPSISFSDAGEEMLFTLPLENRIFRFDGDRFSEKYELDYGEYDLPAGFVDQHRGNIDMPLLLTREKYGYNLQSVFENDRYLFLTTTVDKAGYRLLHDKKQSKTFVLKDDIEGFYPYFYDVTDEEILAARSALELRNEYGYGDKDGHAMSEEIAGLKDEDNLVVLKYAFK